MSILITKTCGMCRQELEVTNFSVNRRAKDGLHGWCKSCCRKAEKDRYAAKKEERRTEIREWQKKHPDKVKGYKREWYKKNKESESAQEVLISVQDDGSSNIEIN